VPAEAGGIRYRNAHEKKSPQSFGVCGLSRLCMFNGWRCRFVPRHLPGEPRFHLDIIFRSCVSLYTVGKIPPAALFLKNQQGEKASATRKEDAQEGVL